MGANGFIEKFFCFLFSFSRSQYLESAVDRNPVWSVVVRQGNKNPHNLKVTGTFL